VQEVLCGGGWQQQGMEQQRDTGQQRAMQQVQLGRMAADGDRGMVLVGVLGMDGVAAATGQTRTDVLGSCMQPGFVFMQWLKCV
jgi:hypothetical protein